MLLDANLLLYAADRSSAFHETAAAWLTDQLNGPRRVGFPWPTLTAFVRISTNPRVYEQPLTSAEAMSFVEDWLGADGSWTPTPGPSHAGVFGEFVTGLHLTGPLVSDAHLAALAVEHGLTVCSNDSDFARFPGVRWENPLA